MSEFCKICGVDKYICQLCAMDLCSDDKPPVWKQGIGNVCPDCISEKFAVRAEPKLSE